MSRARETTIHKDGKGRRASPIWIDALLVLGLTLLGAWARLEASAQDGSLARGPQAGLLKSDPGLLYYLTERVANAEGWLPDDWNADPRIAAPELVDIPADYTVGQEFLLAWTWRIFGGDTPLFLWCQYGAACMAAFVALGVWGLTRELCGGRWPAFFATLLYLALPASYRTVGFVLIREDLSLPLFALHLWFAARAVRIGQPRAFVVAALFAVLAMGTWHAMSFVLAIEAAALSGVFLLSAKNPVQRAGPWILATLLLGWLLIPSLGSGAFWFGTLVVASMWIGGLWRPLQPRLGFLAAFSLFVLAALGISYGDDSNFEHVYEVLFAKLAYGGTPPQNPLQLSFNARLLWQGPFATMSLKDAPTFLGTALFTGAPACFFALLHRNSIARGLALFSLASLLVAWLIVRMSCLPAIMLPPLAMWMFVEVQRHLQRRIPKSLTPLAPRGLAELCSMLLPIMGAVALVSQVGYFMSSLADYRLSWYQPGSRVQQLAQIANAVEMHVPVGEAVASDFMSSTTILAHSGHPIILQPKWERASARDRVERFWDAFYMGTAEELREHLLTEYECKYLVIDRPMLWTMEASRYCAGLEGDQHEPPPGTAAASLLGSGAAEIDGFHRLWSSGSPGGGVWGPELQLFTLQPPNSEVEGHERD